MIVNLISLGCAKNRVDSEKMLALFGLNNAVISVSPEESDVIIINTCGFINDALKETAQTIRKMQNIVRKTGGKLIVFGCAVNRPNVLDARDFPAVSGWYRIQDRDLMLTELGCKNIKETNARLLTTSGYAYLKIADGCSNCCSYCTIPSIKGPYRSRPINDIVTEAEMLGRSGIKELILIAQDTTAYGIDIYRSKKLPALLRKLSKIKGIKWIRLLYAHPRSIDENIIRCFNEIPEMCRYIDMPLQHVSDRILTRMNRKVNRKRIEVVFKQLAAVDNLSIRTTFIAGFPGETAKDFKELYNWINNNELDWFGVFPYNKEPGTKASKYAQLKAGVIDERYGRLLDLQNKVVRKTNSRYVDGTLEAMLTFDDGSFCGHTEFSCPEIDSRIIIKDPLKHQPGDFIKVFIKSVQGVDLYGEIIGKS